MKVYLLEEVLGLKWLDVPTYQFLYTLPYHLFSGLSPTPCPLQRTFISKFPYVITFHASNSKTVEVSPSLAYIIHIVSVKNILHNGSFLVIVGIIFIFLYRWPDDRGVFARNDFANLGWFVFQLYLWNVSGKWKHF